MGDIQSVMLFEDVQNIIDNSVTPPALKPSLTGPLSIVKPYSLPGYYSFVVFFTIKNLDADKQNEICMSITDAEGKTIFTTGAYPIPIMKSNNNIDIVLNLRNLLFQTQGQYHLCIYVNNEFSTDFCFLVEPVIT